MKAHKAILVTENGETYYGWSFCQSLTSLGEIVFNTGMTGYQEVITDPSYSGQIVNFTYPEIGNTGINNDDVESGMPLLNGIITKNICINPSNWRLNQSLISYMKEKKMMHIYGIDTRKLTKYLRSHGTMYGCISTEILEPRSLRLTMLNEIPLAKTQLKDSVINASTSTSYHLSKIKPYYPCYYQSSQQKDNLLKNLTVIVIDFGVKYNILRNLSKYIKNVIVVPASTNSKRILEYKPDGVLLSNGPGDPENVQYAVSNVLDLMEAKVPLFGICMGHQIISLALGLRTFKLRFGHRGLNHPVGLGKTISISSQNHGYAIKMDDKKLRCVKITQFNGNDLTIAAISHKSYPFFSVQYHPEASPGPHDSETLFLHFIRVIELINRYPVIV
uniref:Carbamoyl phosphate synthase small chain n=1 Tax=Palmaria palmata TaxID=2822 RepID=A0A1C9CH91_PALPL|nr:carbamoyl-phosphate synthase arginine-specific small subunit [Palmaria palmata]AOM67756.1 carbamoyl-phosphate synthase arginine-specific small subunit [Palmaria palmata]